MKLAVLTIFPALPASVYPNVRAAVGLPFVDVRAAELPDKGGDWVGRTAVRLIAAAFLLVLPERLSKNDNTGRLK